MIRTQIYLPKLLYKTIDLVAQRENKPKAQVIRGFLTDSVDRELRKRNGGRALLKIAAMAKKYNWKGPKDLSKNIDKYLYEDI